MPQQDYFYQIVGFHFAVSFIGLSQNDRSVDARFQSVSGLDVSFDTETIKEGGENRFEHVIPFRTKYANLVLKRGVMSPESGAIVTQWCIKAFERFGTAQYAPYDQNEIPVKPIDLDVILLNEKHQAIMKWSVRHAWPKAWKFGELNAEKSEILLETLELQYNGFSFKK